VQCVGVACARPHTSAPRAAPHPHPSAIIKFYQPGSKHPVGQDHRTLDHRAENSHRRGPCCTLIDFQVGHVISFGLFAAIRPVESLIDLPPYPLSLWFCVSPADPALFILAPFDRAPRSTNNVGFD